jgi:anti-sigma B factor antagonist
VDLQVSTRPGRNCTVVEVQGELDLATEPQFRDRMQQVISGGADRVVVDLAGVGFMDSSGLGTLAFAFRELRAVGRQLFLAAPQNRVRMVLAITAMDQAIPVYDTVDAADDDLGRDRPQADSGAARSPNVIQE